MQNEKWLAAAKDNFKEALSIKDMDLARAIIMDTIDEGYREEAKDMYEELSKSSIGRKQHVGENDII